MLERLQNKYLGIIAPWYVINDTLHHDLNVPYVRDEIKGLRYADRMEEHPNKLAANVMKQFKTKRRLKTTSRLMYLTYSNFIEQTSQTGHMLFNNFHKLSKVLLNIAQSDSL